MRKKSLLVLATAAVMVLGGAFTAHAEETQWYVYGTGKMSGDPAVEDNLAQADAWAERHKSGIADIANIEERYAAVVNEVVNFLDYDVNYMSPMMYYTIRDQKGVCSDYTLLTGALCDKVGIEHSYIPGTLNSAGHIILYVNVGGEWRYSDPTNFESGAVGLFGTVQGWLRDENVDTTYDKLSAASACGTSGDELIKLSQMKDTDCQLVKDRYGNEAWIPMSEAIAVAEGKMSLQEYLNKYGLKQ